VSGIDLLEMTLSELCLKSIRSLLVCMLYDQYLSKNYWKKKLFLKLKVAYLKWPSPVESNLKSPLSERHLHDANTIICDQIPVKHLQFYVPTKNFSIIWRRHHCLWRAAKFRPMLGTQGLRAERNLYCATIAVTGGLGFYGLIRRTVPLSRLLWLATGYGGPILTRILTGV
jgi:hypothetical protein